MCQENRHSLRLIVVRGVTGVLVLLPTFQATAAYAALIGHWEFDEQLGMSAVDSTTGNHDGTIHGATRIPGKIGSHALNFDGLDDVVDVGVVPALDLTSSSYTLAWWHNWDGPRPGPSIQRIINMDDGDGVDAGYSGFLWSGSLTMTHNTGINNNLNTGIAVPVGIWQHMAVTFDSGTNTRRLYIDGDLASTSTISGGDLTTDGNDPLLFGAIDNIPGFGGPPNIIQFFLGSLDDIRIYDDALNAAQVRSISTPVPGDVNLDSEVDEDDIDLLREAIINATTDPLFDLDGIGGDIPNEADFDYLVGEILGTARGDGDLNNLINFIDFVLLSGYFNMSATGWRERNYNIDNVTGFSDFVELSTRFGMSFSNDMSSVTPEPNSMTLILLTFAMCRYRESGWLRRTKP